MNGYDAQDMASQGADGFRNGYQAGYADAVKAIEAAQPAAAQEAVGYVHGEPQFGNAGRKIGVLTSDVPVGTKLYAAPVTAAPAGAIAAMALCANAEPQGTPEGWEKYWDATHAEPGIDMGVPGATLTIDGETFTVDEVRAALLPDASEAGNESPQYPEAAAVCAEAYQVVGSLLSDIGQFGTELADKILDNLSNHRLVHTDVLPWPSFAQDSPKGGSDARAAEAMADEYQKWIDFYHRGDGDYGDFLRREIFPVEADGQAQAGDAEVRP